MNQPTTPNTVEDFLTRFLDHSDGRLYRFDQVRAAILADRAQRHVAAVGGTLDDLAMPPVAAPVSQLNASVVAGDWKVRERRCAANGDLISCFVEAPPEGDMAYGLEVLGDDYTGYGDVERKLEHCKLIVALVNDYRAGRNEQSNSVDTAALADFIRTIDNDSQMGAGELAKSIVEWLRLAPAAPSVTPAAPVVAEGLTDEDIDTMARKHGLDGSMIVGHRRDYWRAFARDLLAAHPVAPAVVAEGLRLLPVTPTPEMIRAGYEAVVYSGFTHENAEDCYSAMIAAHPVAGSPAEVLTEAQMAYVLQCRGMRNMAQRAYALGKAAAEPMPAKFDEKEFNRLLSAHWNASAPTDACNARKALLDYVQPMPASEAVGYVDPLSITNLKAGVSTNEWLWAKPEAGNVPLYTAAPVPASEAALSPDEMAMVTEAIRSLETGFMPNAAAILRRLIAAPAAPTDAQPDGLTLSKAMDASYPIPDTPHASVRERAMDDRKAFMKGWNACVTYVRRPAADQAAPSVRDAAQPIAPGKEGA